MPISCWKIASASPITRSGRTLEEIEEEALDTTQRDERFDRSLDRDRNRVKPA